MIVLLILLNWFRFGPHGRKKLGALSRVAGWHGREQVNKSVTFAFIRKCGGVLKWVWYSVKTHVT